MKQASFYPVWNFFSYRTKMILSERIKTISDDLCWLHEDGTGKNMMWKRRLKWNNTGFILQDILAVSFHPLLSLSQSQSHLLCALTNDNETPSLWQSKLETHSMNLHCCPESVSHIHTLCMSEKRHTHTNISANMAGSHLHCYCKLLSNRQTHTCL